MQKDNRTESATGRREFLKRVSAGAAAGGLAIGAAAWHRGAVGNAQQADAAKDGAPQDTSAALPETPTPEKPQAELLPTIQLGDRKVTRLVAGWNPIGGHSHSTLNLANHMKEYFTVEKTVQFILDCEKAGINTWQLSAGEKATQVVRQMREAGSEIQVICLHAEKGLRGGIDEAIETTRPFALVHHGGVTDALFRAGRSQEVHDYVKKVHDAGLIAGVSAHNPDNIKRIADEGWENDLFMCCFYYVTRPVEEQEQSLGKVTVGEPFFKSDPEDMTDVVKQVDKPCLGFKILAAGRSCWSTYSVEKAFKYAFANIKPTDGVIVGMYPKFRDEVADNATYARQLGAVG